MPRSRTARPAVRRAAVDQRCLGPPQRVSAKRARVSRCLLQSARSLASYRQTKFHAWLHVQTDGWGGTPLRIFACTMEGEMTLQRFGRFCSSAQLRARMLPPSKTEIQFNLNDKESEHDRSTVRRIRRRVFSGSCIFRNLYRFPLRLRRQPNRVRRTDEPKRADRGAPFQTVRLSRHSHLTFKRAKRYGSNK